MPNKLLGQHFLKNPRAATKMVDALTPAPGEIIFEVGPGRGELTVPLAEACKAAGARIVALEKDRSLAEALRARMPAETVQVLADDALKVLVREIQKNSGPFKITGNLPYYLTGHLLRIISELERKPVRCVFTLQKEVAERIMAKPPRMNRLAASVQFWAEPDIIGRIPREDFYPAPNVDSAIIALKTRHEPANQGSKEENERYFEAIRMLFAQPRKTIVNNLRSGAEMKNRDDALKILGTAGIKPDARPQDLSIKDILAIAKNLSCG